MKGHMKDILSAEKTAHSIALGFSVGSFIAILPLFGLSIVVGLAIALLWKDVHKIALFFALAFWNPVSLVPVYLLSFHIGDLLFGNTPIVEYELDLVYRVFHLSRRLLVGNLLLGLFIALCSYPLMKRLVCAYRTRHRFM